MGRMYVGKMCGKECWKGTGRLRRSARKVHVGKGRCAVQVHVGKRVC